MTEAAFGQAKRAGPVGPSWTDIEGARSRIDRVVVRTPLLRSDVLDEEIGAPVWLKAECLQRTGSFKIRGAYACLTAIAREDRLRGVVAFSSGNHAQGVAEAARLLGMSATIVMPADAPLMKIEGVRSRGGVVRLYDRFSESREEIAAEIAERTGATLVPPFEHPIVVAGQATASIEAIEDAERQDVRFGSVVCCASGGGLIAGAALAFERLSPGAAIYSAEPEAFDDHARSLSAGRRVTHADGPPSICDALMSPLPGEMTFSINATRLKAGLTASDDDVLAAMAFAFAHLKLVVEPGGAAALAALRRHRGRFAGGGPVLVFLTGGNVDADMFARAIRGSAA